VGQRRERRPGREPGACALQASLGLWSAAGVDEGRQLFWRSFESGKASPCPQRPCCAHVQSAVWTYMSSRTQQDAACDIPG
jgi:hypothetical protein